MLTIKPFRALRPIPELAAKVSSLPYDVMNTKEAAKMAEGNDVSFLHVIRSEIDLPDNVDPHDPSVYEKASKNLNNFIKEGVLIQDEKPCFYVYQQTMNGRTQTGIAALVSIDDYQEGRVKKHEFTLPAKEEDRIQNFLHCNAHTEPIFLINKQDQLLQETMYQIMEQQDPTYSFTSDDGIKHVLWVVDKQSQIDTIQNAYCNMDAVYIADGHHRASSSYRVGEQLRKQNPDFLKDDEFNFIMAVIFSEEELMIMDYNRLLKDISGYSPEEFLEKVSTDFIITSIETDRDPKTTNKHHFSMYLDGKWYDLEARSETYQEEDVVRSLDASILQENIFHKILGIDDPRTTDRLAFVGGIRGYSYLQDCVDRGDAVAAFGLYPVLISDLLDVADSGMVMPPKSTWFEPKLRSGLFIHQL